MPAQQLQKLQQQQQPQQCACNDGKAPEDRRLGNDRQVFELVKELVTKGELHFFAINVNDYATESYRHSLNDDVMRATDVMIDGRCVLVCGYKDVDKSCAFDFCDSCARVFIVDCAPIGALQADIEVLQVAAIESVVSDTDTLRFPYK